MFLTDMDPPDRDLLNLIQSRVPLVREPFAELAGQLGWEEKEVLERLRHLREQAGVIREIAGIFGAAALGYALALAALRVGPPRLDQAGQIVAGHPGVSHCYAREGTYNLWFTLAVSPQSRLGLEGSVVALARKCGASSHLVLPTLRRYKLDVRFGAEDDEHANPPGTAPGTGVRPVAAAGAPVPGPAKAPSPAPTQQQVRAIQALQIDLPIQSDPFAPLARSADMDADDLLVHAADFLAVGWMRRYAATLHHRAAGAAANVMVAWKAAPAYADAAGALCAQVSTVSHCYLRPAAPDWPYNLYTMIHGQSREDCAMTIDRIISTTGLSEHLELWTKAEYRKQRVRLFSDQEAQWEEAHLRK